MALAVPRDAGLVGSRLDDSGTRADHGRMMLLFRTFLAMACGAIVLFIIFGVVMFSSAWASGAAVTMSFLPPATLGGFVTFVAWSTFMAGAMSAIACGVVRAP